MPYRAERLKKERLLREGNRKTDLSARKLDSELSQNLQKSLRIAQERLEQCVKANDAAGMARLQEMIANITATIKRQNYQR